MNRTVLIAAAVVAAAGTVWIAVIGLPWLFVVYIWGNMRRGGWLLSLS